MAAWLSRLALVLITIFAGACAGGVMLGAASAETRVTELIVTCLTCGEQWLYVPSATVGTGLLSLFRRRKLAHRCPMCHSQAVIFGHAGDISKRDQGRTA